MPSRPLLRLPVTSGPAGVRAVAAALGPALDGSGPALALLPEVSQAAPPEYVEAVTRAVDPDNPLDDDEVAVVLATSGSTGSPKAVLLTAAALAATADGLTRLYGEPAAHWVAALPVTSVGGLQVLVRAARAGTHIEPVASVGGAQPFTPHGFVAAADALTVQAPEDPLATALVPTQLLRLLGHPAAITRLQGFAAVLLGGAAAPPSLLEAAQSLGIRVITTYGMTETAGGCVYDGTPLPGVQLRIDEADDAGHGRIVIGGDSIARGYRGDADHTRKVFVDGWFRTGDVGVVDAGGQLQVIGRFDDIVQIGGVNVAVGAVERIIADFPDVAEAAVVAVPDPAYGARLVAYLVRRPDARLDEARRGELLESVRAALGPAAVPRLVRLLDSLPQLPSGKVDRAGLRVRAHRESR
ncbi:MAG: hypothetical protein EPO13_03905 [Actinomycetota bacterium]|nr:MAG: hypothetical protein EPO13_03905 [Actinomycetota bacterium]